MNANQRTLPAVKPNFVFVLESIVRDASGNVTLFSRHFNGPTLETLTTARGLFVEALAAEFPDRTFSKVQAHVIDLGTGQTSFG